MAACILWYKVVMRMRCRVERLRERARGVGPRAGASGTRKVAAVVRVGEATALGAASISIQRETCCTHRRVRGTEEISEPVRSGRVDLTSLADVSASTDPAPTGKFWGELSFRQ